jgi:hypothetical protein
MERLDYELTESIEQRIYKALRLGANYELAARYAGIPVKWFWRWKKEGENEQTVFDENYHQKCRTFLQGIKQARADYEVGCLTRMEQLKNFKALHWKWERLQGKNNPKKNKQRRSERHENKNNHQTV